MSAPAVGVAADLLARGSDPASYVRWRALAAQTGYCSRPVRLAGRVTAVDRATGEVRPVYDSADEPDGVLLTACRNRRSSVCRPCSATYQADTWQLVSAGLQGGKGVPDSVGTHPRLFVTLTAPSFGAVHSRVEEAGQVRVCRPRRRSRLCSHGNRTGCQARHEADDPAVGSPLCVRCYDFEGAVLFNAYAPELWRRFTQDVPRQLAHRLGLTARQLRARVRLRYAKVAEGQRRGLVHFHAVLRLDAASPDPAEVLPPPAGFTSDLLAQAVQAAAERVQVRTPELDQGSSGRLLRFGAQLDIRHLPSRPRAAGNGDAIKPGKVDEAGVAGYLAKYVTKATTSSQLSDRPFTSEDVELLDPRRHLDRMAATAWALGALPQLADRRLRRWAHMLGFRGHITTKSRCYSTTMTALRRARVDYRLRRRHGEAGPRDPWGRPLNVAEATGTVLLLADWRFAGSGHRSRGDELLAATAAADAREAREGARLERCMARE